MHYDNCDDHDDDDDDEGDDNPYLTALCRLINA